MDLNSLEAWFVTGSQHLYGEEALKQVADNSRGRSSRSSSRAAGMPVRVVFKPVMTTPEAILGCCREANAAAELRRAGLLDAHLLARPRCGSPA